MWTYTQRTIDDISQLFKPLEDVIRYSLIPSIIGRECSELERKIISPPTRLGGLNIQNPIETADAEFRRSVKATSALTSSIVNQQFIEEEPHDQVTSKQLREIKSEKQKEYKEKFESIYAQCDNDTKRCLDLAQEKGSSLWLATLPIASLGYTLNKQEFLDSIAMRYNWEIRNVASFCECGKKNSINHALTCPRGGYTIMRHNEVRDLEAELLKEVC